MIEIQNLSKRFDQLTAVDNLSFTVKEGEVPMALANQQQ
jgi:ABC-type Na+ transport system ATPase subunit NatA